MIEQQTQLAGEPSHQQPQEQEQQQHLTKSKNNPNKLTLLPLIFLIYFGVSGGPYGAEPAVQAGGALFALLGFLIFPFIWGIPESLVTAELATAIPGNGGFVLWAERAFGPLCGSLMGTWKFLSGAINIGAFPVLCVDYLAKVVPSLTSGTPRTVTVVAMNLVLTFVNYTGLTVVGYTAVALGLVSLMPFVLMTLISIPKLRPRLWLVRGRKEDNDWRLFFNTLFWNLNYWDGASTMAGEVENPGKTFPRALLVAGLTISFGYLLPLMAGIGAVEAPQTVWENGYFATVAGIIAGNWLKIWIEVGATLSSIGLYNACLSGSAFQLLGMAELGLLPQIYASRAKWFKTPWAGIITSSAIGLAMSFMSFQDIISSANFLYSLGMLMEFAAFIWLRLKKPELVRPYRVPMRIPSLLVLCFIPSAFLIFIMALSTWKVFLVSIGLTLFGIVVYYVMFFCKIKGCFKFNMYNDDNVENEKIDV